MKERGIVYYDEEMNTIEDIGLNHLTVNIHLMWMIPEIRNFCERYEVHPRHPSGLFIE